MRSRHWVQADQKAPTFPKPSLHQKKWMICGHSKWHCLYKELLPENTTITASVYCAQLQRVADILEQQKPKRGKNFYLHDNARAHVAKVVKKKIEQNGWDLLTHPAYSPDIAPTDYHLFRSLSNDLRGRQFKNEDDLKSYLGDFFDSKSPEFYTKGIYDLPTRWSQVIARNGQYVS